MNIAVLVKVVPDDQDIQVKGDRTLDYSKAKPIVSTYDLNAIEAAAQIAASNEGSQVVALTVGPKSIDDAKLKKNICARGVDKLVAVADDAAADLDAYATAQQLAALIAQAGPFDLILAGDGSADNYAQQVDVQLAAALGLPVVNAACAIEVAGPTATVQRSLEDVLETVEVDLPAVVSVTPDIALPRIPGMKEILAAGKKPMEVGTAPVEVKRTLVVDSCLAPEQTSRKLQVFETADENAIAAFANALKAAL